MKNETLTIREAANIYHVSELGIWALIRQKQITAHASTYSNEILVYKDEIADYFDSHPDVLGRMQESKG